jgi:putative transposase
MRRDFLHKLSNYYARGYDLVAVEELEREGDDGNSVKQPYCVCRVANVLFIARMQLRPRKDALRGGGPEKDDERVRVVQRLDGEAAMGRDHSCLAYGFEADRDANAAWNICFHSLQDVRVGHSEQTPVELSASAKRAVESGSPTLKERPASAASKYGRAG